MNARLIHRIASMKKADDAKRIQIVNVVVLRWQTHSGLMMCMVSVGEMRCGSIRIPACPCDPDDG